MASLCLLITLQMLYQIVICIRYEDSDYIYYDNPNHAPYRFDTITDANAQHFLHENGYIVIKNIFQNTDDIDYAHTLLWKYLNRIGWQKHDPNTWNEFPGYHSNGIIFKHGIGQSELQWFIRTQPKLLRTFHSLWNLSDNSPFDEHLISSFDGIGIFRPWMYNTQWETFDHWYHIDQNIVRKPGLDCYQGLVSLTDQNYLTGSTVVIPKSHLYTNSHLADTMNINDSNFQLITEHKLHGLLHEPYHLKPTVVSMNRGDLLLWDSRLIHCSVPSLETMDHSQCMETNEQSLELLRVVSYVCFTPKYKASEGIIAARMKGFEKGQTSNHNPHQISLYFAETAKPNYSESGLDLNLIKRLVGY